MSYSPKLLKLPLGIMITKEKWGVMTTKEKRRDSRTIMEDFTQIGMVYAIYKGQGATPMSSSNLLSAPVSDLPTEDFSFFFKKLAG